MSAIIQEALDNKPFILQLVENLKAGKSGGSSNNVFDGTPYSYTDSNIPAKEFLKCLFYIWQKHPSHWNWKKLYQHWNLRIHTESTSLDLLSQVPKEHLDLLPPYVLTKVKKHKSVYVLDTKKLVFDEFALATFTMWLESKKKLTSTECLSMLRQINRVHMEQADIETIKLQYVNLLWQYTPTKSIELSKYYCEHFSYQEFYTRLPVAAITSHSDLSNIDGTDIQAISFSISWYQWMADIHRIPVSQAIMTDQWSTVYTWITGVPKSTPLNAQGIAIAIDQIIILAVAELKLPNLAQSISKLKQQLIDELLSKRYAECGIKQLLADRLANLNPIQSILGDLHERL